MKYVKTIATMLMISGTGLITAQAGAQDTEEVASLKNLDFLIGEWSLETNYTNGNRAVGTRTCEYTLRETNIKCSSKTKFDDGPPRDLVSYYSYNTGAERFEEVTIYQFPVGKKLADLHLNLAEGKIMSRGYIYGGDGGSGPRMSEDWTVNKNSISTTIRLNRGGQPAHVWPVFIEEKMTRKK